MRWDTAPLRRKLLGGICLLLPLCFFRWAIEIGLMFLFFAGAFFPRLRYPYPRKQRFPAARIFFAGSTCLFLLSFFQFVLLFAGRFFFSVTPLYLLFSRMIALLFALPMGTHLLFLRIKNTPAFLGGGMLILLSLFIACR